MKLNFLVGTRDPIVLEVGEGQIVHAQGVLAELVPVAFKLEDPAGDEWRIRTGNQ